MSSSVSHRSLGMYLLIVSPSLYNRGWIYNVSLEIRPGPSEAGS